MYSKFELWKKILTWIIPIRVNIRKREVVVFSIASFTQFLEKMLSQIMSFSVERQRRLENSRSSWIMLISKFKFLKHASRWENEAIPRLMDEFSSCRYVEMSSRRVKSWESGKLGKLRESPWRHTFEIRTRCRHDSTRKKNVFEIKTKFRVWRIISRGVRLAEIRR